MEEIDEELAALLEDEDIDAPKKVEKDNGNSTANHYSKYTRAVFIENVISPTENSETSTNTGDKSIKASDNA